MRIRPRGDADHRPPRPVAGELPDPGAGGGRGGARGDHPPAAVVLPELRLRLIGRGSGRGETGQPLEAAGCADRQRHGHHVRAGRAVGGVVGEAVGTGVAGRRGVREATVGVERQGAVRDVGVDDRGQRVGVGIGVVGEDTRGGLHEGRVLGCAVAVGHGHRGAVGDRRCGVDRAGARVGEGAACDRQELPVVGGGVEGQLEHAVGRAGGPDLAGREGRAESAAGCPAGADREGADAVGRVDDRLAGQRGARLDRGEALIDMVMTDQQDVDAGGVQVVPQRLERLVIRGAGAVARLVPQGDDVLGAVGGEVGLQPQLLGRARGAATDDQLALAVEVDDVPVARGDVVAVVVLAVRIGRAGAEVGAIRREGLGRGARAPVVVAGYGSGACLDGAAPAGLVAVRVIGRGPGRIDVVAGGPDGARDSADRWPPWPRPGSGRSRRCRRRRRTPGRCPRRC